MKKLNMVLVLLLFLGATTAFSQSKNSCKHCNMAIKDELHKATAIEEGNTINFDAIECLINYLKKNENLSDLKVVDYESGKYIAAETAYYLKSKAIPSPMGAYLSAFQNKAEVEKMLTKKGGEVYNWKQLVERFQNSDFGALEHEHYNHYRPDTHAPIGVMGDHLHHKGGLMVSFRHMDMTMKGNKSGTSTISDEVIYEDFMVAPQQMNMRMYMLGLMYAPSDKLTFMAMQNFIENEMDLTAQMRMMNGMKMMRDFRTTSTGIGDLKLGSMYGVVSDSKNSFLINAMVNLPLGSIQKKGDTPMMKDTKLPYTMQLGSGTVDYTIGATFKKVFTLISLGTQFLSTYRTGKNREEYRLGNLHQLNLWGSYVLSPNVSMSVRLQATTEEEIEGADPELNPKMVTTASTVNYGGEEIKSYMGLNLSFSESSALRRLRMGVEVGVPFYEDYLGIQMDEELSMLFGLKFDIL